MASWTDILPTFKPYVQQLPVEAMVQVGMQKQAQYNAGIQKIQGEIDKVAGLDIYRDVDKNYLQSKLNELGDKMTFFAAGDFSDFQLTNSVSGMTNQIIKDKYVQNAVSSTAKLRKESQAMEKSRSEGKSSPNNEAYFLNKVNRYASSTSLDDSFNDYYIPFTDINKKAIEIAGKVGVSADKVQKILDAKGNIASVMTTEEMRTNLPQLQAAMELLFQDPNVRQQLQIDGWATYRDATPSQVLEPFVKDHEQNLAKINQKKLEAQALLSSQNLSDDKRKEIETNLANLNVLENSENSAFEQISSFANKNFEQFKQNVYEKSTKDKYMNMFSDTKHELTYSDNPLMKLQQWNEEMKFKYIQEKNSNYYKAENLKISKANLAIEQAKFEADYPIDPLTGKRRKVGGKKREGEEAGGLDYSLWSAANPSEIQKTESLSKFYESVDGLEKNVNSLALDLFTNYLYQVNNGKTKDGRTITPEVAKEQAAVFAKSTGESPEAFLQRFVRNIDVKFSESGLKPSEQDRQKIQAFKANSDLYTEYQLAIDDANTSAENYARDVLGTNINNIPKSKTINLPYTGKTITLDRQDIIDYYTGRSPSLFTSDDSQKEVVQKSAIERIAKKYGRDVAEELFPVAARFPSTLETLALPIYLYDRFVEKEDKVGLFKDVFLNKGNVEQINDYKYQRLKPYLVATDIKNVSFDTKEDQNIVKNKMMGLLANNQLVVTDGNNEGVLEALSKDDTKVSLTIDPPRYPGEGYKGKGNIISDGKITQVDLTEEYIKTVLGIQGDLPQPQVTPEELRIKKSPFQSTNLVSPSSSKDAYQTAYYQPEKFPNLQNSGFTVYGDLEKTMSGHNLALYIKDNSTNRFFPTINLSKPGSILDIAPIVPTLNAAAVTELIKLQKK